MHSSHGRPNGHCPTIRLSVHPLLSMWQPWWGKHEGLLSLLGNRVACPTDNPGTWARWTALAEACSPSAGTCRHPFHECLKHGYVSSELYRCLPAAPNITRGNSARLQKPRSTQQELGKQPPTPSVKLRTLIGKGGEGVDPTQKSKVSEFFIPSGLPSFHQPQHSQRHNWESEHKTAVWINSGPNALYYSVLLEVLWQQREQFSHRNCIERCFIY